DCRRARTAAAGPARSFPSAPGRRVDVRADCRGRRQQSRSREEPSALRRQEAQRRASRGAGADGEKRMTHDGKHVDDAALDEVARAYEAAEFHETPPPQVDSAILNRAAQELQRSRRRFTLKPAYLAWAAM